MVTLKISVSESKIKQYDLEEALEYTKSFIGNLGGRWRDMSPSLKSRFQKLVFPYGIPYSRQTGFGTAKLGSIYEINRQCDGDLSTLVDPTGIEPATS